MNETKIDDTIQNELKIVVEKAVRPVRATLLRKRRMREELLAHLTAIFEEELEKLGDDRAALHQTKRRFGDPKELTAQLQDTVHLWDRLKYYFEKWGYQPGEYMPCCALKCASGFAISYVFLFLVVGLPSLLIRGRLNEFGMMLRVVFDTFAVTTAFFVAFFSLIERLARVFFLERPKQELTNKVFYGILSLLFFPAFGFLSYWALTGDVASSLVHLRIGCYIAPAGPVLLIAIARQLADEIRYKREWASLKIDE